MYPCAQIDTIIRGPCPCVSEMWVQHRENQHMPKSPESFPSNDNLNIACIHWSIPIDLPCCTGPPGLWLWKASWPNTSAGPFRHSNQVWGAKHCLIPTVPSLRPNSGLWRDSFVRSAQSATNCSPEMDRILFSKEALVCSVMTLYF